LPRSHLNIVECLKTRRLNIEIDKKLKNISPEIYIQSNKNLRQIIDDYFYLGMINGLERKMIETKILLNKICYEIEAELKESCCLEFIASVYFFDDFENRLYLGASPNGIPGWNEAIESLDIIPGPNVASCGTSLYMKEPVIVSDTYTDVKWESFQWLARKYQIRTDWSVPFFYKGKSIGTFVLIAKEINQLSQKALELVTSKARELEEKLAEIQEDLYRIRNKIYKIEGIVDLDGKIEMVKSELSKTFEGWYREDIIHPADRFVVGEKLQKVIQNGGTVRTIYRTKNEYDETMLQGEWIPTEVTWQPVMDDDDDDEMIALRFVALLNTPDCKLYETENLPLQKYYKFHAVTDSSGHVITSVGTGLTEVLGIKPTAWMGTKKYVNIHPDDYDRAYAMLYRARDEKRITKSIHRFIGKDGKDVILELHFIPIINRIGMVTNIHAEVYQGTPECQKFEWLLKNMANSQ
jgi:PAS domain-containing protein